MKTIVKRIIRDEKGASLVLVLILLLIGGLIIGPLLSYMGTGLITGEVYEMRTDELYAADAGVEDAIWKIQNSDGYLPCSPGSDPRNYTITDEYGGVAEINDKSVEVTITCEYSDEDGLTYHILSTATGDGSGTTIEAYLDVLYMDFSALLDNAIVSQDTITIRPNTTVDGDVWLPINDDEHLDNKGNITGEVKDEDNMSITWPTVDQLSGYYLDDVNPSNPYPDDSIDIKYTKTIGPCYRDGDLVVDNTGEPDTLILDGTVYVTGDLEFEEPGASSNYTVNLNGNTIFVEGSITFPPHFVSISGSGCIIAVGDIYFQPSIVSGEDDFVLVMSIEGTVEFHPSGDFTGCVAGNVHVQLQPNSELNWISPEGKGLDFPMGAGDGDELPPVAGVSIVSWEVIPLWREQTGG